jgi:hypothetical protein
LELDKRILPVPIVWKRQGIRLDSVDASILIYSTYLRMKKVIGCAAVEINFVEPA